MDADDKVGTVLSMRKLGQEVQQRKVKLAAS